jgi:hypothetical protein
MAALKRFQELEQRFPEGDFAELAHEKVLVCREMLARNEMIVGNYYYKRANFRAAESRFAELLQKYPETPVAPDALFELGISLEKEGKRYSAAQAFAAVEKHFPNTGYAKRARTELAKLHQPIDTEEDPLPLVLAETGYGGNPDDSNADKVVVRQRSDVASAAGGSAYGSDGLPVLNTPSSPPAAGARASLPDIPPMMHAPDASQPDLPNQKPGEPNMMRVPAPGLPAPTGSIAGAAAAQARAMTGAASSAPEPSLHQMESGAGAPASAPLSLSEPPTAGPATLKTIRLSSNDPPLSVVLELSGPVSFDKNLQSNSGGSTATVVLKDVTPDSALQTHLVFDKSIFKDCNVSSSKSGTTVTLNMQPVAHFAVGPPRLLVTFTPQAGTLKTSAAN